MSITTQIAKHVRGVHFGKNWSESSLKEHLDDVTWQEATQQVYDINTIATLTYHINYYIKHVVGYLQGGALESSDKDSFNHPPFHSQADWDDLKKQVYEQGEQFAKCIEAIPDDRLLEIFREEKYGNHFYNFIGIVEHMYYHLGQLVLVKKIIRSKEKNNN